MMAETFSIVRDGERRFLELWDVNRQLWELTLDRHNHLVQAIAVREETEPLCCRELRLHATTRSRDCQKK